ncbi:pilus assembly protein TadG-related protein [Oceaniglobus ichthyenteri]|uniref:pilus assembly protein TadG-related protein n=1 Tax=Oceaniglobus ichthyenteri TaxID=2136177 RepID=UPI000D37C7B8|nr:pilus assembly protein TadG-related protein [Oceaniglobus ichthyenteri]
MSIKVTETPAMTHRFAREEDGSLTAFALLLFICMVIIGGISIDIMVFENNRTRLQNLSDRAALAAADLDQDLPAQQIVASYFEKEGMDAYLKDVRVTQGVNNRTVHIETEKVQRTMFLNFWNHTGIDTLTPRSTSVATEARTDLEISLVLDVSNSMNWASTAVGSTSKLADMKSAATRFVDKVYTSGDPDRITMNLVPYSTHVNAGPEIMDELGVSQNHDYSHCLAFENADFDETVIRADDAYGHTMHFDQWYSNQTPQLYVCRAEDDQIVKPVMSDPDAIKGAINDLVADGNTSIEIGLKWGAAFLDPSARRITTRLADIGEVEDAHRDRPYNWNRGNTEKFIVVLTDGVNTTQQEINPDYASGPSGMWRWTPAPLLPVHFYSWDSPEDGDEDGDGIHNERYWTRGFTIPRSVTGLSSNVTIARGWTNDPIGLDLSQLEVTNGNAWQRAALKRALVNALSPTNQPPVELDYASLWNEMAVRHFASSWVRTRHNSSRPMNQFYRDVWRAVEGPTKDTRLLTLCNELRDQGATIFTIGFEVTNHSAGIMGQCASTPNYFIRVVGDNLEAAFDQIANTISKLRLTQ